jgi:hypothetical protein
MSAWKLDFSIGIHFAAGTTALLMLSVEILVKAGDRPHIDVQIGPVGFGAITVTSGVLRGASQS